MKVLVNGLGNIGTTLLELLIQYQSVLGIESIYALKNQPMPWHKEELKELQDRGVIVCSRNHSDFVEIERVLDQVEYVFDCTSNGGGVSNKAWYESMPNLIGACAQGSEKSFGTSFMTGINEDVISQSKFAHIVSCNTHSLASLMHTFSGFDLTNIKEADFVVVRRSEDIGNHQRLVSANVVARHLNSDIGTHHSIDVKDLFETIDVDLPVTSSDVTTPSQLMHGVRFNISLKDGISDNHVQFIEQNGFVATSIKFDSNVIFERGRRYGFQGRIFSHAVIIANNLIVTPNSVKGWAFIPQEGNTLLSTIHAFLLQTKHLESKKAMHQLTHDLLKSIW